MNPGRGPDPGRALRSEAEGLGAFRRDQWLGKHGFIVPPITFQDKVLWARDPKVPHLSNGSR